MSCFFTDFGGPEGPPKRFVDKARFAGFVVATPARVATISQRLGNKNYVFVPALKF